MNLPSSARAPVVLLAIGLVGLIALLAFDSSDLFDVRGSAFISVRADLRHLFGVTTIVGAAWLAAVMQHDRTRQYTDARVAFTAARLENVVRQGLADVIANADTAPMPRLHVVRGTAAVVSPLETIDPNTVSLLRRLDSELRGDDQR